MIDAIENQRGITIFRVAAAELYPFYGRARPSRQTIWIVRDLPRSMRAYVEAHERYHLRDTAKNPLWREIKAIVAAIPASPVGFLRVLLGTVFNPRRGLAWLGHLARRMRR